MEISGIDWVKPITTHDPTVAPKFPQPADDRNERAVPRDELYETSIAITRGVAKAVALVRNPFAVPIQRPNRHGPLA